MTFFYHDIEVKYWHLVSLILVKVPT